MQHSQKPYSVYSVYSVVIKSIRTLIPAIGNSLSAAIKNRLGEAVINGGEDGIGEAKPHRCAIAQSESLLALLVEPGFSAIGDALSVGIKKPPW